MKIEDRYFEKLEGIEEEIILQEDSSEKKLLFIGGFILFLWIVSILFPLELAHSRGSINLSPSLNHPFGTDSLGRDIFFRMIKGFQLTFLLAFLGGCAEFFIGGTYGTIAGLAGKRLENILMRVLDVFASIPYLLLVTLIILAAKNSSAGIILAVTITGWMPTARITRGEVLKIKEENYVKASKLMGAGKLFIIKKHIAPNLLGILIASVVINIPKYIFAEAFLSFLGMGFAYPKISWGMVLASGQENIYFYPYQIVIPGAILIIGLLLLTLIGDYLKKRVDGAHWRGYYG